MAIEQNPFLKGINLDEIDFRLMTRPQKAEQILDAVERDFFIQQNLSNSISSKMREIVRNYISHGDRIFFLGSYHLNKQQFFQQSLHMCHII